MSIRTSQRSVTFRFPFSLRPLDGPQPPGTYTVETDEELLEQLSFPVYHRVATSIRVPLRAGSSSYRMARIDPAELEEAERRDASAGMRAAGA